MSSNFMKFLENLDEHIYADTVDESVSTDEVVSIDEEVMAVKPKSKSKKSKKIVKKNASVGLVEKRIRTKLDDVGLNTKSINEVVSYVLGGVHNIAGISDIEPQPQKKQQVREHKNVSMADLAGSILDGVPEMYTPTLNENTHSDVSSTKETPNMSNMTNHASSLL